MTISYKLLGNDPIHNEPSTYVLKKVTKDGKTTTYWIPKTEKNSDYLEYLEWIKSNTPESAD
jgi:hypothetical protein|tara:strand:+ start:387 stop:572 length:186 start_codon:yes stop_codon:yes gene_type:complete